MIIGYKKLKYCEPGQLVRFSDGTYLLLSEYKTGDSQILDAYISGTGEHFVDSANSGNEWVAIIDYRWLEQYAEDEAEYPPND